MTQVRTFPVNAADHFDPAIRPGIEFTRAVFQETPEFPSQIRARNTLKHGIAMSYWACIDISHHGIYDVDLRDLPNMSEDLVNAHAEARSWAEQRQVALELFARAFINQESLIAWLETPANLEGPVVKMHRYMQSSSTGGSQE